MGAGVARLIFGGEFAFQYRFDIYPDEVFGTLQYNESRHSLAR